MNKEIIILSCAWAATVLMLLLFTPKIKLREAIAIFFFKQFLTWLTGLIVAQFGLIEYPIRSFPIATRSSFDFEYFFYPSICVIFNLYYPMRKNKFLQFMHFFYYCSVMTIFEAIVEKYTNIIKYIHWSWYLTWITLFITFFLSNKFYIWYFKLKLRKDDKL